MLASVKKWVCGSVVGAVTVGVLFLGCGGCASRGPVTGWRWDPDEGQVDATGIVWPALPETPRIAYVNSMSRLSDFGVRPSIWKRVFDLLTGLGSKRYGFVRPFGVGVDKIGNLCVADPGAGTVYFFDKKKKSVKSWQEIGDIEFVSPVAIVKRNDILVVADSELQKVVAFDESGEQRFVIGEPLQRPVGLAVLGDLLMVVDAGEHDIKIFNFKGRYLFDFGERGTDDGQLNYPTHITVGRDGRVYVVDSMNQRLQVFDAVGGLQAVIGSLGDGSGHFSRPKGVAVDQLNHVYVVDAAFDNVQVFSGEGRFLLGWGCAGEGPGEFCLPAGIATDGDNRIFVADAFNRRIQVFKYIGPEIEN